MANASARAGNKLRDKVTRCLAHRLRAPHAPPGGPRLLRSLRHVPRCQAHPVPYRTTAARPIARPLFLCHSLLSAVGPRGADPPRKRRRWQLITEGIALRRSARTPASPTPCSCLWSGMVYFLCALPALCALPLA
jgi:hypothetical protein